MLLCGAQSIEQGGLLRPLFSSRLGMAKEFWRGSDLAASQGLPSHFDVLCVDVKTDEAANVALFCSQRGMADADEWVEHDEVRAAAVDANTIDRQLDRKGGRMRPLF